MLLIHQQLVFSQQGRLQMSRLLFLTPGWIVAYAIGVALWALLFVTAGAAGVYVLVASCVLLGSSLARGVGADK
jgi:hypothetical protein